MSNKINTLEETELNIEEKSSDDSKKSYDIRQQVQKIILENICMEVTPETKHNISGIYMIYIDKFTSEKIIPIYVGQATDIQRRYKQHFHEILALNRLSYDEYNEYFFSKTYSFYEGNFKTCKIFKFMIENNCTLQDYHMVILERVEVEHLEEKEQEYFQRLLPSFFGFNQFNSFLKGRNLQYINSGLSNTDINNYLDILLADVKGIYSFYEYGFTRFNFEHSFPKDISFLLNANVSLDNKTSAKYQELKIMIDILFKDYLPGSEKIQKENNRLYENQNKLYEIYSDAEEEYNYEIDLLENDLRKQFKELKFYSEKAITYFKQSIVSEDGNKYKELFNKYLNSKKCNVNFFETFENQIKIVNKKLEESNSKYVPYQEAEALYENSSRGIIHKRYRLIFPTCKFDCFSLGDRASNFKLKINEDYDLLNTCHIGIYISNNGISRGFGSYKEPSIIRFDYCYIDNAGNKTEKKYYIDNETTRFCKSGIEYFEKDYYDRWAIKREPFKISGLIDKVVDNSFISITAEYKHGINDYTIKDKKLIKLSTVLSETLQLIDEDTRFNIAVSESGKCLERCFVSEGLQNNRFVEKLVTSKLPNLSKSIPIKKIKKAEVKKNKIDKTELNEQNKIHNAEAYKRKIMEKSDTTITVLNYISSREKATAKCSNCSHIWEIRSDHLLARPYCPLCRKTLRT